jgi:outer membrane protein TolC
MQQRCEFLTCFAKIMSIYTPNKSVAASLIAFMCATALAETPEALVRQALQRNPELNFFVAEIAAAKGSARTAGTVRNPELSSELGYKNSRDNSGGGSGDGAIVALSLAKPLSIPVESHYVRRLQITISSLPNYIFNSFASHWPRAYERWPMAF